MAEPQDIFSGADIYRSIIEQDQHHAVVMLDIEGIIRAWNLGAQLINGYASSQVIGRHFELLYTELERSQNLPALYLSQTRTDGSHTHAGWILRKDGQRIWADIKINAIYDPERKLRGFYKVITDLTEHKMQEDRRWKTQEALSIINKAARIGVWEVDMVHQTVIWDEVTREIHGVPEGYQPILSEAIGFYKEGDCRDIIAHIFQEAVMHGTPYDVELIIVTAQGRELWCRAIGQAEFRDGECIRIFGTIQDIDLQKRTQIELQLSEEQFRRSFELSAMGMSLLDLSGRVLRVNRKLCEILGYTQIELSKMTSFDVTHPDDNAEDIRLGRQLLTGEIDHYTRFKRFKHKDGSIIWSHITLSLVRDAQKNPIHFVSEIEDITEKKKAEDELKRVNEELTAIFNSGARVSMISADLNGTITHFNRGAEDMLGYKAEEIIGKASPLLLHLPSEIEEHGAKLSQTIGRQLNGREVLRQNARELGYDSREWTYVRKDGSTLPVQVVVTTIKDDHGQIVGYLGIATDITKIKEAEASVRKYALLEAKNKEMEQFTFIASHDLLEPLQTVSSFVELLTEEYSGSLDENAVKYIQFISGSTRRMMDLVKGLLHYSRLGKERQLEFSDCNLLLQDVIDDLGLQIAGSHTTFTISHLPSIEVYPMEFKQLLQNLIINAIKFRKPDIPPHITIYATLIDDRWTFVVTDNGIGIADRNKEKIFAIFQRLHDRHEYTGMGIGLAYCQKIVEMHNGSIWVESIPDLGSSFYFTISTPSL